MSEYQIKNVSKELKVGIWKITESTAELLKILVSTGFNEAQLYQTKNEQRLKQWIATRILLNNFFEDAVISYDDLGKPHLNNGWYISISHSNEFVAIIVNKQNNCGIDIEKITPKIERIKHKFLNQIDLQNVTSLENLTLYWGAKEALYKYYGKKEVLFIEHLFIEDFAEDESSFTGKINLPEFKIDLLMEWGGIEDYMLVYTL